LIGSDPDSGVPLIPGIYGAPLLLELLDMPVALGAIGSIPLILALLAGLVAY